MQSGAKEDNVIKEDQKSAEPNVIPVQRMTSSSCSDEDTITPKIKVSYKKNVVDILKKLKLEVVDSLVEQTSRTYYDYCRVSNKNKCATTAVLIECLVFNGGPTLQLPSIHRLSRLLGITLKQISKAKNDFKKYCKVRGISPIPNTIRTYEKIVNNKSVILKKISQICNNKNYREQVNLNATRLTELLHRWNALPLSLHQSIAEAVIYYVLGMEPSSNIPSLEPISVT